MGVTSCLISNVSYQVKASGYIGTQTFSYDDILEVPGQLTVVIEDYSGTANFTRGEQIQLIDSVDGVKYSGYVLSSRPTKLAPGGVVIEHTVTATDKTYPLTKIENTQNYQNWYAGDAATDMVVNGSLASENVSVAANVHHDTTDTDFNRGILSGTVGTTNDTGDGDLELAPAGTDVTITEKTTADFSTGTLANCAASNNTLVPSTQSALKLESNCLITQDNALLYIKIWSGSKTVGSNDTLNYSVWISDSSPQRMAGVDLLFSDGSRLRDVSALSDQNAIPASPTTDLSNYAENQWYARTIALTGLNGKTITAVLLGFEGNTNGSYTAYFKNIYLGSASGSPFFSTSATTAQVNPPVSYQNNGYVVNQASCSVVQAFDPANSYRLSTVQSIDAVKLLRSSLVSWIVDTPGKSSFALSISYDGGTSFLACTNNGELPTLPSGSNVTGMSIMLKEAFTTADPDPTIVPTLASVSVSLTTAPNPTSAKADVTTTYATSTAWNTGTHAGTTTNNGALIPGTLTRNWNDNLITNQTLFGVTGASESASGGVYAISLPQVPASGNRFDSLSRLDFASIVSDFTIECDMKVSTGTNVGAGIVYRQIAWYPGLTNTFGYCIMFLADGDLIELSRGSNSTVDSFTSIATATRTINTETFYHVKLVVKGSHHQFYFNNETTPCIDVVDDTYSAPGNIGFRALTGDASSTVTSTWDNFQVTPDYSSTWTSAPVSISGLGTCGASAIAWAESNTANESVAQVAVQTSIDGGSTYQDCTNGEAIPNLTPGSSVSGKSVIVKITMTSVLQTLMPMIPNLTWRVLGAYPGSTGTRSTAPMGLDNAIRANQAGWGTAQDGQAWAKTGTGTDAVSSNALTISNTTGDVFERLGSRTGTDLDETVSFTLSASTMTAGMALRYVDANNCYLLKVSTAAVSIIKKIAGVSTTLATVSVSISTNTQYWMRFRVVGSNPVALYGNVWAKGVLEPTIDATTYKWNDNNWTIQVSD